MKMKKNFLLLIVLLLCDVPSVRANVFDRMRAWMGAVFSRPQSGNQPRHPAAAEPDAGSSQEPQLQDASERDFFEEFVYRCFPVSRNYSERQEDIQAKKIQKRFNDFDNLFSSDLQETLSIVAEAKDSVNTSEGAVKSLRDGNTANEEKFEADQKKLENEISSVFDKVQRDAKQRAKEQKKHFDSTVGGIRRRMQQQARDIVRLQSGIVALRKQWEDDRLEDENRRAKDYQAHIGRSRDLSERIEKENAKVQLVHAKAEESSQQLEEVKGDVDQVKKSISLRQDQRGAIEKELAINGDNHKELMELVLGLNKKFELVEKLSIEPSQEGQRSGRHKGIREQQQAMGIDQKPKVVPMSDLTTY